MLISARNRPCHGVGGWLPVPVRGVPGYDPRSAHAGSVVDKVALVARFSPRFFMSVSFQQCSILVFIYMFLPEGQNNRCVGTFQKSLLFRKSG